MKNKIINLIPIAKGKKQQNTRETILFKTVCLVTGGGGSSIVKVPGDVPPARVYFFGLLV